MPLVEVQGVQVELYGGGLQLLGILIEIDGTFALSDFASGGGGVGGGSLLNRGLN